jgi:hypothetical protein
MKGKRKPFSKSLHGAHDDKARKAAIEFFTRKGFHAIENPNTKGVDILVFDPKNNDTHHVHFYVEVEVKNNWAAKTFQYDTLQIPERKGKYLEMYGDKILYMIFSKDLTQALIADSVSFKSAKLKEVSNKYMYSGEYFFQVPVKDCELVQMEEK